MTHAVRAGVDARRVVKGEMIVGEYRGDGAAYILTEFGVVGDGRRGLSIRDKSRCLQD